MTRKCALCGKIGHNSRTCATQKGSDFVGKFRLFGVQLDLSSSSSSSSSSSPSSSSMRKSLSMDCLSSSSSTPSSSSPSSLLTIDDHHISDDLNIATNQERRKKGLPWSEEEHRMFLFGLGRLGKGDWRGMSRNFVTTRTPTQVASHAQKYFLRQNRLNKTNLRSSPLFDVTAKL